MNYRAKCWNGARSAALNVECLLLGGHFDLCALAQCNFNGAEQGTTELGRKMEKSKLLCVHCALCVVRCALYDVISTEQSRGKGKGKS